jgi:hypothetical protein
VLRTYARRFRFAHPTTADFVATVNEVTGRDWQWFFDQTFYSSASCDYAVEVEARPARTPAGWLEGKDGKLAYRPSAASPARGAEGSRVMIVRHGEVTLPVELRVELDNGRVVNESWDGRDRWKRFEYPAKVVRAVVDPDRKLAIDVDPVNNEWIARHEPAARASTKWAERFLLWLQAFLEMNTVLG